MDKILFISLAINIILVILFCKVWRQNYEYKQSKGRLRKKIKEVYYGKCKGI
ncbi:hypothetical protein [Anaerotignum propionicum]|uniref:hypothetical protein n=1 Tax=Anaerotignum propionicum TaxID=28446 RepID=UPI00289EF75A|nr:hypothetical protein [Anaerotignum propionicum]